MFCAIAALEHQALVAPVGRHEADAAAGRGGRDAGRPRPSGKATVAAQSPAACRRATPSRVATPEPSSPASPTISPGRASKRHVAQVARRPARPATTTLAAVSRRRRSGRARRCAAGTAPPGDADHRLTTCGMVSRRAVAVMTTRAVAHHRDPVGDREHLLEPVRDVEDRDAVGATARAGRRTGARSPRSLSAEFGSSRISTRGRSSSTRQSSTSCRSPMPQAADDGVRVGTSGRSRRSIGRALRSHRGAIDQPEARRLAVGEQVGQHRAVREEAQLLVDDADAGARASARRRRARTARRRAGSSPRVGRTAPARIFISVDLPAPFSPTTAWTVPATTSRSTPASAWIAAVALAQIGHGDRRTASAAADPLGHDGRRRPIATCDSFAIGSMLRRPVGDHAVDQRLVVLARLRPASAASASSSANVSGGRPNGSCDAVGGDDLGAGIEEAAGRQVDLGLPRIASTSILTGR